MRLGNVGPIERIVRVVLGTGLLVGYFVVEPRPTWALLGIIPLVTGLLAFCPLYGFLRRREVAAEGPSEGPGEIAPRRSTEHIQAQQALPAPETEAPATPAEVSKDQGARHPGRNRAKRDRKKGRSRGQRSAGAAPRTGRSRPAPTMVDGKVAHATDATFKAMVLDSDRPVLVDFWAEWCGPCKAIAPVLEELAGEVAGKARIVKVDVDSCPRTAGQFNIRSIPTLVLFKDGDVADVLVGLQSKSKLSKLLR
jgi:thioredoxin 1